MTELFSIELHKKWQDRDRTKDKPKSNPVCDECGCDGNNECGHLPYDVEEMFCGLKDDFVCGCCKADVAVDG